MTQTTVNKDIEQHRKNILCSIHTIHDLILNQCSEYTLNSSSYVPAYPEEFNSTEETLYYWEQCIDMLLQDAKDYYNQPDKDELINKIKSLPIEDLV